MRPIYVYTEQDTTPRFFELVRAIRDELGITNRVLPYSLNRPLPHDTQVVVFGNVTDPAYTHTNNIYTYSPAQVLTKANAVTVVGAAFKLASGVTPNVPHAPKNGVEVIYQDNPRSVWEQAYDEILAESEVVIDIETSGNIKAGTVDDDDVELLSIAFYLPNAGKSIVFQGDYYTGGGYRCIGWFAKFLVFYTGKSIYHNGKFDTRVLNRLGQDFNVQAPVDEDTMLMHHVLYQAAGMHGLKQLCKAYFNAPDWEAEGKKYTKGGGHFENIPFDKLALYNGLDVYWTYVLYQHLRPMIDADENAIRAYDLELQASEFLLRVEQRGIPFDTGAAESLQTECEDDMGYELYAMRTLTENEKFNPNSPKQVKEALAEFGYEVTGTSVQVLEELKAELNEHDPAYMFIDSLLIYRKNAKIVSTYVKGWMGKERNGLVHPTFLVHGTSTGRLSSTSPNAQNMPRNKKVRAIVGIKDTQDLGD